MNERKIIGGYRNVVVKVGTTTLTHANGKMNLRLIAKLAMVLTDLQNQGYSMVLVTSGAIAVGADKLGMESRPRDILGQQAASAVGQAKLMHIYESFFLEYGQNVAQVLLTKDCIENKERYTNAKNTMLMLKQLNVIPIVNENDTVSTAELGFADNDALSAHIACLIDADLLIMLTDSDGFYDSDPKLNPGAKLISFIGKIDDDMLAAGGKPRDGLGTGGGSAKIHAAQCAAQRGIATVIASGKDPMILYDILSGEDVGTFINA
jgi:glutamate 5-kinase